MNRLAMDRRIRYAPRMMLLSVALAPAACASGSTTRPFVQEPGITKIKHIIVIMQENRSFDSYF
ncbi:MAG TPA: hypothetical protein VF725_08080, partial [Ktedonobacterales bacterium]